MSKIARRYKHKLLCGDCTIKENIDLLMNGERADMVFTDPPYGMNLNTDFSGMSGRGHKYNPVIGDNKPFDPSFILEIFNYCENIILWGADYFSKLLPQGTFLVWDKKTKSDCSHESSSAGFTSDFELCWSKKNYKKIIHRCLWIGAYGEGRDEERKTRANHVVRFHPTQKPISLLSEFIEKYSDNKKNIVDLFLGSGSTLIACEKTNRKCYGMEISPEYCQVIIERWKKYTGKKAYIINNGNRIDFEEL